MRFYNRQHRFYCGIDLHARTMYVCIMDASGAVVLHRNCCCGPQTLLKVIAPYREGMVIGVECVFTWYWIADLCARLDIPFVLGHALYMKAIHGAKSKNDKIDSQKIATMLRGGMFPMAHAYPQARRSTRDLLRRRMYLMHIRSELLAHIQNTRTQYNLPAFQVRIASRSNRGGLAAHFEEPMVRASIEADIEVLDSLHQVMVKIERTVLQRCREQGSVELQLLRTVPGIGKILALVILYEIGEVGRFPKVGNFISYARLVKCPHESAGKRSGSKNQKIGNPQLKWAFSEAAVLFLRDHKPAELYHHRLVSRYGKAKALSIIAQKLGRTVYFMLKRKEVFDPKRFFEPSR
jgi:transposase